MKKKKDWIPDGTSIYKEDKYNKEN